MPLIARATTVLARLHWRRGLRAGFAVATAMITCRLLHRPMGWAALGGFEAVLADNGGPYRSRMNTIATVLLGGALCGAIGTLVPPSLLIGVLVTAAICFIVTYARVISQPIASTAVIIIVIYFAGYGSSNRTLDGALTNVVAYILGGLWAAVVSLFLWPVDPFRPARIEIAACYDLLANFTAGLHTAHDDDHTHAIDFKRQLRSKLESARAALSATTARAPARTVRARNLSVLLETADMLFALTVRLSELVEVAPANPASADAIRDIAKWLSGAETAIALNLRSKPPDNASSFQPQGSYRIEFISRRADALVAASRVATTQAPLADHLRAVQLEALQNIDIAFEALRAVWTGAESRPSQIAPATPRPGAPSTQSHRMGARSEARADSPPDSPLWIDALRQNWSLNSVMMRHALRMAVVGAVDVVLIRMFHVSHGFWLAMTSIVVLQPYGSGTVRKSFQRVGGTVAGGILAAVLAASIHNETGIILVITACAILTLATYAINYAWYSFFLTPTFVLLSLPYLRDWRYAGVRIFTTLLGALAAIIAMRTLWPQSLRVELGRLLSRSASAVAAYVRALLLWWTCPTSEKSLAERKILAPARRACGLTSQDAEEALDRILLEPALPTLGPATHFAIETDNALTFTTYIRRFTQSLTTLGSVGAPDTRTVARLTSLAQRLEAICATLDHKSDCAAKLQGEAPPALLPELLPASFDPAALTEQMLQRMERQAHVLERAAVTLAAVPSTTAPGAARLASDT